MAADDLCKYADPESTIMSIHNLGENAVLNEILRGAIDEKISDAWLGLRFKGKRKTLFSQNPKFTNIIIKFELVKRNIKITKQ